MNRIGKFVRPLALLCSLVLLLCAAASCGIPLDQTPPSYSQGSTLVLLPDDEAPQEQSESITPLLPQERPPEEPTLDENGAFSDKDDVALYLHLYGRLPANYITKKEAQSLGWEGGSLEEYAPGCSIGGTYFGNYEERLPVKKGREYRECDIDTAGKKSRGSKRLVYSNDGLIYYTDDHYETFTLLYGEE